jgi:uncharacterized membrane protein YidH (DUF202 family)
MVDLNFMFMIAFMALIMGLAVANFVEATQDRQKKYQNYFGIMYLMIAVALVVLKIQDK